MKVTRELFEARKYPDRFPEFRRFIAFCDANNLEMSFYEETPYIGIRISDANDEPVTRRSPYTIHYHTMEKKVYVLDCEDWDAGMGMLNKTIGLAERKNDDDLIASLGSTIF